MNSVKFSAKVGAACTFLAVGSIHIKYSSFVGRRKPYKRQKGKPQTIAVVGSGIIGLTTAYYLSQNPLNKVVLIDKNIKPYRETSYQNGCFFHT